MSDHVTQIARERKARPEQVAATVALLDDDATVPFIARYRKEATGGLDEVAITAIRDRIGQLRELDKRRAAIVKSLTERDQLTPELDRQLKAASTMAQLEDIYLPYKPKRRTRATIARERGLEPLAGTIFAQDDLDPFEEAELYVDAEKEVASIDEALAGARDIIAEWINQDGGARTQMRRLFAAEALIESKVVTSKKAEAGKFRDYFEWREPARRAVSHRVLAMLRGEREGMLSLKIGPDPETALGLLDDIFLIGDNACTAQVQEAIEDCYKRLLAPSMANEIRAELKAAADTEAIKVFTENLRELLLSPPIGRHAVMAIDPGFRTGCKLVCLDKQGKLLHAVTIQPHASERERQDAGQTVTALIRKFKTNVIAIGNGTASRETERFVRELDLPEHLKVEIVNEAGASVYSASDVAREEFPDHDVTVRGAVSIGRRLQDPLAELVKIDPKAIGVGQYQHDVDQSALRQGLDDTVMSCVNAVGVEVNTASKQLLTYVSGLGPALAKNVIGHRDEHGPFRSRKELTKVARLGPKAFEQAAGFLRIREAAHPLDRSAVHPESYAIVERMASDLGCTIEQLMADETLRGKIQLKHYVTESVGLPTLRDIMEELARPGRDPRPGYESVAFDQEVNTLEDLKVGMKLPGVVTNVTDFGAFVDVGVHQDGLVHISQLADRFVEHPSDVVRVQQRVTVTVLEVDLERGRISLSMRAQPEERR